MSCNLAVMSRPKLTLDYLDDNRSFELASQLHVEIQNIFIQLMIKYRQKKRQVVDEFVVWRESLFLLLLKTIGFFLFKIEVCNI